MAELWARAIRKNRIVRSETVSLEEDDLMGAIGTIMEKMDLPRPLFLGKHEREWSQFAMTSFLRDHFMESIAYDRIEIERIDQDAKKKRSQDPRNA